MSLQNLKDSIAKQAFGMTMSEAHEKGICVKCKMDWKLKTHSEAGKNEYRISGLCEDCFDDITKVE